MRFLIVFGLVVFAASAGADDKKSPPPDTAKLVGRWEPAAPTKGVGTVLEFAKDGTAALTVRFENSTARLEGTYTFTGNKLTVTLKTGLKEQRSVFTVMKLNDTVLEYEDGKGRAVVMKRLPK